MSIIRFFWQHIKPYKWSYALMLSVAIINCFHPFVYNYAIKLIIDTIEQNDNLTYQAVILPVIIFLANELGQTLIWRIYDIVGWHTEPYVKRSILLKSYDYVQHHSYLFFQDNFTGSISSKLKGILSGYDKLWNTVINGLGMRIVKVIINFCALAFINTNISLFIFLWTLFYVPVTYKLSQKLNILAASVAESKHSIIGQIADKITNIISIFAFATKKEELNRLDKQIIDDFIPKQIKELKFNFIIQIISGIFYLLIFAFLIFYTIYLRNQGLISIGDFAFIFGIALVVTGDIWYTVIDVQKFARDMGDIKSSLSIIWQLQQNPDMEGAADIRINYPKIEFRNINFSYGTNNVFKDLNLIIQPGEKVGIVGYSGAGKSTLVNLLLRYFPITGGEILIDEHNIAANSADSIRKNIAVIPQDTSLFHRTILENIRYGRLDAIDEEVIAAAKKAHIHEFIMTLPDGYNSYVGERGVKLSGGQRQRIAIARAVLKDAPVLVLDEATSALDSHNEQLIQDSLNLLIKDKSKTVIAIAHRLSTLKHMDRIIVLKEGTIIEQGMHDILIKQKDSLYKKLWQLQHFL